MTVWDSRHDTDDAIIVEDYPIITANVHVVTMEILEQLRLIEPDTSADISIYYDEG